MIFDKQGVIDLHTAEFEAWERLLSGLSPAQRTAPQPGGLSVKDTLAHLAAWQQRTIARLEAARLGDEPQFPVWPVGLDDLNETRQAVDQANAWILEANRQRSWSEVYQAWRAGYLRFLELLRAIPAEEMRPGGSLAWTADYEPLEGYPGRYDYHHAEHRAWLEEWLHAQQEK